MVRSLASYSHLCLPSLAILFNLWVLRQEPIAASNFNDSSLHLAMLRWARYQIDQGRFPLDGWYPYLGLGLPQFHHYQSLPHLISGFVSLFVGTDASYFWSLYLLLAFWPISVYFGSRLFGWGRWTAAGAALVAPLLVSATSYGYEHTSYMWWGLGMWTQLWGMWLLPFAWALGWRAVSGRGSYALGALVIALTIACHFLTGYLALLMIVVWVLIKPSELFVRLLRGVVVGGGAALIASWVIVPLLSDSRWQLATQYQQGTFWDDSYGAPKVLGWLFTGQIYDEGRLPVVTVLVAVGVAVCAFRFRKDERARTLLGAWVLSLLLFFGRPTLGSALKLLPGSDDLLFHRFLMGVHLAGIILAGVGASWLALLVIREGRRRLPRVGAAVAAVGIAGIGLLALMPAWTEVGTYDMQNASLKLDQQLADATDGADLQVLIDRVKTLGAGRVYAGSNGNWGAQYAIGHVPVYNVLENQDIDAIGFNLRTSSLMTDDEVLFDERNPAQYDLFNIKYLILPADRPPLVPAKFLGSQGRHRLWQVETSGYLEVVDTVAPPIVANRRNIGSQTSAFLQSSQLTKHQYSTVAFAGDPAAQPTLTSAPIPPSEAGTVESQSSRPVDGSFSGVINANRQAVVLLKASYDPRWKLTVDGVNVKTQMIAPALVGGLVSPGRHTILFQYARYPYYPQLLALGLITLLGLAFVPRFVRRRRILSSMAPPLQAKIPLMPSLAPVRRWLAPLGQSLRSRVLQARASPLVKRSVRSSDRDEMELKETNRSASRLPGDAGDIEVSIVMPCLNEAETLAACIRKAQAAINDHGLRAEVIVADNGSDDGSREIALALGARVVDVPAKGYGNALQGGIEAAHGRFVIMGDADDSYDFSAIYPFVEKLREGYDLVMGDRLGGEILPGAMPWLHRWIGNPILSLVGRVFFGSRVRDFHSGLRAFTQQAYGRLRLRTTGMELASEMVIRASLLDMRITDVPIVLHKDGRSRPPHLRRWRDGWRHLRFMLLFSPRWLFFAPGVTLFCVGLALSIWVLGGSRQVGPVALDIHTLLIGGFLCIVGYQLIVFAAFTKIFALREGFHPPSPRLNRMFRYITLEIGVLAGLVMTLAGLVALGLAVWTWQNTGFGKLDPRVTMREAIPSVVLLSLGIQTIFASFFLSILGMGLRGRAAWDGSHADVELPDPANREHPTAAHH